MLTAALRLGLFSVGAAALIGWLSARLFWPADMFAPFRLQYAALFLVAAGVGLLLGQRKTAALAALLFLWQAVSLVPLLVDPDRGEPVGQSLRLLHFNVLAYNTNYDAVAEWVAEQDADVVVLQETTPEWGAVLERRLTGPAADWVLLETNTVQPGTYGIMMFVRQGLEVTDVQAIDVGWYPAIATTVTVDGQDLLIYGLHTLTPTSPSGLERADEQVDLAAGIVLAHNGPAVIVGDLNATRWSPLYRRLNDQVELRDAAGGQGLTGTWPNQLWFTGRIGIDHVLVTPGMCTFNRRLGPANGSDHLPVVVDLTVEGCA